MTCHPTVQRIVRNRRRAIVDHNYFSVWFDFNAGRIDADRLQCPDRPFQIGRSE